MDYKTAEFNRLQVEAATPRRKRVVALREAGETWASIGHILGITHQRAQQLAKAYHRSNGKARG